MVTALSVPLLKERVDCAQLDRDLASGWSGSSSCCGPSVSSLVTLGALAALIAAIAYALGASRCGC